MRPSVGGSAAALLVLTACAISPGEAWRSPVGRDEPLVGRIWDVEAERFLDGEALIARLASQRFVLLGEKHDNADHHRLQARVVDGLVAAGRRPAVAFEMISVDLEEPLAEVLARSSPTPADLREAVRWEESGWPDWSLYEPVAAAALRARLSIVAADLPSSWISSVRRAGLDGLDPAVRTRLALDEPLPEARRRLLADRIREAHCGHVPEGAVDRMVDVQRARDAHLARAVLDASLAGSGDGAVLVAGAEHARRDVAVPVRLARWAPEASLASVAFVEVDIGQTDPARDLVGRYGETAPFDYLWFTPRVDDLDPCEKFKHQLERLKTRAPIE